MDIIINTVIFVIPMAFSIFFASFPNEFITKKSKILSAIFFISSIVVIGLNRGFLYENYKINLLYGLTVLFFVLYNCYFLLYEEYFNKIINKLNKIAALFVAPFISLVLIELFNNNPIYKMSFKVVLLNYLSILILYLFLYIIINKINAVLIIGNIICYLAGVIYYYVLLFRGTPILPTDFFAVKTAGSVLKSYELKPNFLILCTLLLMISLSLVYKSIKDSDFAPRKRAYIKIGMIIAVLIFALSYNNLFSKSGLSINLWQQRTGYKDNGVVVNFLMNTKYLKVDKPQDYSIEKVNHIISKFNSDNSVEVNSNKVGKDNGNKIKPNVIVIMNETFSDLSVINKFSTNEDYMPFIHSLKTNTIKGNLYVSTFGGNTANTEWEFLTGNSMAFIPSGAIPYQQYLHQNSNSIAANLKYLGYKTLAIHPYEAKSWNRDRAYELLGFDRFINIEDFKNPEILRGEYISDAEDYKKVIEEYKNKGTDERIFIFNVTIQNHGGYYTDNSIFNDSIYLTNYEYTDANEYLSLIKKSDEAFKELLNYFSKEEEPTVILMFGDHMPALDTRFYEDLYGKSLSDLSIEEMQRQYITPFILWANYDIDEKYIDKISANYLSTLLLNTINEQLTGYNKFLQDLCEKYPVINKNGYVDANNNFYSIDDFKGNNLINQYKLIQYNNVFDTANSNKSFFSLGK